MPKKAFFAILIFIFISLACGLNSPAGLKTSPSSIPFLTASKGAPQNLPTENNSELPAAPDGTEQTGRSAGIDLLTDSSGTATPDAPPTLAPQAELALYPSEWYPLNATDVSGDFSVTALGWGIPDNELLTQPGPGFKFVRVDAVLTNHSSAYRKIWSEGQASLKDDAGNKYNANKVFFRYELPDQGQLQVAPGEHLRHEFFFSVPQNVSVLTFQYDICSFNDDAHCDKLIAIPLVKASTGGSVPPEINFPDPNIHAMGEVLTQGNKAFSAIRWEVIPPSQQTLDKDTPTGINLIKVSVAVANLGQKSDAMGMGTPGTLWISLKDRSGRYFVSDSWDFGRDNHIQPGEWAQGRYYFQVPPGAVGLELVVDAIDPVKNWPALTRTFISLGEQPVLKDSALGQMPGSLAPNAVPLGQPGQVGSLQITMMKVDFPNTSACSDLNPGERAVLVTASVQNNTSSEVQEYSLQADLKDSQGISRAFCDQKDVSPAANHQVGKLAAGETRTVQYSYIMLEKPGDLWLAQYNLESPDKKIFFLLK